MSSLPARKQQQAASPSPERGTSPESDHFEPRYKRARKLPEWQQWVDSGGLEEFAKAHDVEPDFVDRPWKVNAKVVMAYFKELCAIPALATVMADRRSRYEGLMSDSVPQMTTAIAEGWDDSDEEELIEQQQRFAPDSFPEPEWPESRDVRLTKLPEWQQWVDSGGLAEFAKALDVEPDFVHQLWDFSYDLILLYHDEIKSIPACAAVLADPHTPYTGKLSKEMIEMTYAIAKGWDDSDEEEMSVQHDREAEDENATARKESKGGSGSAEIETDTDTCWYHVRSEGSSPITGEAAREEKKELYVVEDTVSTWELIAISPADPLPRWVGIPVKRVRLASAHGRSPTFCTALEVIFQL